MTIGRAAALLALVLATPGGTVAQVPLDADGAIDQRFEVGGLDLRLRCTGPALSPHPTLVLEADLGRDVTAWDAVVGALPGDVRACAWDRPGTGGSQPAPPDRPMDALAGDLRDLLATAGVAGPYVLVADGLGGWFAAAFAVAEPDLVAGMVWTEPVAPTRDAALRSVLGAPTPGEDPAITVMRDRLDDALPPPTATLGHLDITAVGALATPLALGDRPLVLLDAADAVDLLEENPLPTLRGVDPATSPWRQAWDRIDAWALTRSSTVLQRAVPGPTGIIDRAPGAVVDAIADVHARLGGDRGPGHAIARLSLATRGGSDGTATRSWSGDQVHRIAVDDRTGALAGLRRATPAEAAALELAGPEGVTARLLGRDRRKLGIAWRGGSLGCEPSALLTLSWPAHVVLDVVQTRSCLPTRGIARPVVIVHAVVLELRRPLSSVPPTVAVHRTGYSWLGMGPARLTVSLPGAVADVEVEVDARGGTYLAGVGALRPRDAARRWVGDPAGLQAARDGDRLLLRWPTLPCVTWSRVSIAMDGAIRVGHGAVPACDAASEPRGIAIQLRGDAPRIAAERLSMGGAAEVAPDGVLLRQQVEVAAMAASLVADRPVATRLARAVDLDARLTPPDRWVWAVSMRNDAGTDACPDGLTWSGPPCPNLALVTLYLDALSGELLGSVPGSL